MTIRDTFGNDVPQKTETPKPDRNTPIRGKVYHLGNGYGFIESEVLPYTRIFFHWQNLDHNTLHFSEIKRGAELEFIAIEEKNTKTNKMEWRAQKVKVITNGKA